MMLRNAHSAVVKILATAFLLAVTTTAYGQTAIAQLSTAQSASAEEISKSDRILPADLVKTLQSSEKKPLIISVGPRLLYEQAHIPGAELIGPGSDDQGLQAIQQRVRDLPKATMIVVYCGCCPWNRCPNVGPAMTALKKLGFANAKALYIETNFGADWVNKGYPTEKGR